MSQDALFQLGMDSVVLNTAQKEESVAPQPVLAVCEDKDHFIEKDGVLCAGSHLIVDLFEAERLDDLPYIQETLVRCVEEAGATLLHIHLHPFEPNGGVSGVAVLAESHISIHSWPERGYAALDIFMCGDAKPGRCIDVLRTAFAPGRMEVQELLRGRSA